MGEIVLTVGSKDNFVDDVNLLAKRWSGSPRVVAATGPAIQEAVIEKASALFIEDDLVIALLDPAEDVLRQVEAALDILKDRAGVVIYATSPGLVVPPSLKVTKIDLEQEKEKRFRERVLSAVRAEGKKMSSDAFDLLKERIGDEALLGEELEKLISYVGDKEVISAKHVAAVVTDVREEDFIDLSEAMARRNRKEIMAILDALLAQGMDVLAVHGFMTRRIRLLLQAMDVQGPAPDFRTFSKTFGKLKEDLDLPPLDKRSHLAFQKPYYAFNLTKAARKYSRDDLVSFLDMLAGFDFRFKRGTRQDRTRFEAGLLGV